MTVKPDMPIYLVSHTHWDREWYVPFERMRAMLIEVMDGLVDILETEPDAKAFHLDGQSIIIDDYLEVRPQQEALLRKHAQSGRLRVGPWYVAADVVLVSGESLIRNLRYGLRRSRQFSNQPTLIGYMPDQFGHISQMPQILSGFGIDSALMGRGRNRGGETPNEFLWESPDGSQVLAAFINTWYSNARNIPTDFDEAAAYLADAATQAAKLATGPYVLLLNGCDHLEAEKHAGSTVRRLREELGWNIQHTGLEEFMAAVRNSGVALSVWQGEMRQDLGGRLDAGTISSRMPLKWDNFRLLTLLEQTVEPLGAFVSALNAQPDRDILDAVWHRTMQNHPHDSICGCSVDDVAREMVSRTETTRTLAEALAEKELRRLGTLLQPSGSMPSSSDTTEAPGPGYLMYLPAGNDSGWIHRATIDVPTAPSSRSPVRKIDNAERFHDALAPVLTTADGKHVPLQVLSWERTERLVLDIAHLPETQPVHRFEVAFALDAPGRTVTYVGTKVELAKKNAEPSIVVGTHALENDHLRMDIAADGTLDVLHKATGRQFTGLGLFESGGEAGDTYHYVKPAMDRLVRGGVWSSEVVADGPLLGAITIRRTMQVPAALAKGRMQRSSELVDIDIEMRVQLRRDSPFLECELTVDNRAQDHRLRVLFPNVPAGETMRSLAAFDEVDRPFQPNPEWDRAASGRPQLGWTSLGDGDTTFTLLSGDLPEVEAIPQRDGVTLALTLLRCVGAVSRRTANPIVLPAPEAQLLGKHSFSFAIYPHASTAPVMTQNEALALLIGDPMLLPAETIGGSERIQPTTLVQASDPAFVITAVEAAPPEFGGSGMVVRGWNTSSAPVEVGLRFGLPVASTAYRTDLAGNRLSDIAVDNTPGDASLTFNANPYQIVSILVPSAK